MLSSVFVAHLLRGPGADHGLLILGAAGQPDGSAGVRGSSAAGGRLRHYTGHIARHDCRAHRRSDGKMFECMTRKSAVR